MGNLVAWASIAVAGAVGTTIWRRHRPRLTALDRAAAHLVDQAALAELLEQLAHGPMPVRARTTMTLAGPFLHLDLGERCLRMRLYGGWCLNEAGRQATARRPLDPARIIGVHDLGERGYVISLATADGRVRFHGWQIEQVVAPKAPTRPASFPA